MGRWVLACAIALVTGVSAALIAAFFTVDAATPIERALGLLCASSVGIITGMVLGWLEWRVLGQRLTALSRRVWVAVTTLVAAAAWLILIFGPLVYEAANEEALDGVSDGGGGGEPMFLWAIATGALAGLGFGGIQWLVLRRHVEQASRWIWLHVVGWAAAILVLFVAASIPSPERWPFGAAMAMVLAGAALAGVTLGLVTGAVAVRKLVPWVGEKSLFGKICVVTGASSGIGYATALALGRMRATVVLLCKNEKRAAETYSQLRRQLPDADLDVLTCDLASLASIRAAASSIVRRYHRIDVLFHGAGSVFMQKTYVEGLEQTLAVDVLGPFYLTELLKKCLLRSSHPRVIVLTGKSQRAADGFELSDLNFERRRYSWALANGQAQRARFYFVSELAKRNPELKAYAVHPGAVLTSAQSFLPWPTRWLIRTVLRPGFVGAELGSFPGLRLITLSDEQLPPSGSFIDRFSLTSDHANSFFSGRLWELLEERIAASSPTPEPPRSMKPQVYERFAHR